MVKSALITGITGQDGSYLAEYLLSKNYAVHGIVRRASTDNLVRIRHISDKLILHEGDLTESAFVHHVLHNNYLDEIYNLAAQSHVHTSFGNPNYTFEVNTLGLLNILSALVDTGHASWVRVYQASTSEMFGNSAPPQGITTPFNPQSPYALSKLASHGLVKLYREVYKMYIVSGILFNHESPRRGENFVTRKITKFFTTEYPHKKLALGSLETQRDWGFAPDYVALIYEVMQNDVPKDFVLGTGQSFYVKDFLELVGNYLGIDWREYVERDSPSLIRLADVNHLQAQTDFVPYTKMDDLVKIMVDNDNYAERNPHVPREGYEYYMDNYGDTFSWRI